jgi:predicted PolB exonuclease-like 3'-5' exonuclease
MKLVFDIETVGCELEDLDESQQEYLLRFAQKEKDPESKKAKEEDAIRYLSLYPFTAQIIAIAMYNVDTGKTLVLYQGSEDEEQVFDDNSIKYKPLSEVEMITTFWSYAKQAKRIISFNGKQFDIPFLMLRSAIHKIKPSKNYIKNRFESKEHIDLIDKFTFMGLTRKFNLDFYCKSFGIKSPKASGITGMDVKEMYKSGKVKELALYCADDVRATYELFKYWNEYLNIS